MADRKELEAKIQSMIDSGEPDEKILHAVRKWDDDHNTTMRQTIDELSGVVKSVPSTTWAAVRGALYDLPTGLYKDAKSLLNGDKPEYTKAFLDGITNLPTSFADATHEERGQMIGGIVGPILAGKAIPESARPVAGATGRAMSALGKRSEYPLRISGGSMITGGIWGANPAQAAAGVAMTAAPSVLQKTGAALQRFGEPASGPSFVPGLVKGGETVIPAHPLPPELSKLGVTPRGVLRLAPAAEGAVRESVAKTVGNAIDKAPSAADKLADLDRSAAQMQREGSTTRKISAKSEDQMTGLEDKADLDQWRATEKSRIKGEADAAKAADDARKADIVEKAKEGLVAGKPSVRESISAPTAEGGRQSVSTSFHAPEEEAAVGGLSPEDQALLAKAAAYADSKRAGAPMRPPIRIAPSSPMQMANDAPAPIVPRTPAIDPDVAWKAEMAARINAQNAKAAAAEAAKVAPKKPVVDAVPKPAIKLDPIPNATEVATPAPIPNEPVHPPIQLDPSSVEQLSQAPVNPMEQELVSRAAKLPLKGNVPASKSRSSPMSATPGLTVTDAEALGINPQVRITGLTEDAIKELLAQRAVRSATYRTNAGMDAAAKAALDREE